VGSASIGNLDRRRLRWLHIATDTVLVSLGWLVAWGIRRALEGVLGPINSFPVYLEALPVVVLPWIAASWWFGLYESGRTREFADELQKLMSGGALGLLVVASVSFFGKELSFGRSVVLTSAFLNLGLQASSRFYFAKLDREQGRAERPVLIVGTGVPAIRLLQKLQDHPEVGYRVVGFLDDVPEVPEKDVAGHPVLGRLEDLRSVVSEHAVEEVFVALPSLGHTRMLSLVLDAEDLGVTCRVATHLFEVLTAGTQIDLVDDLPLVRLGRERVHSVYEPAKRVFDLVGASVALVLAAPVFAWATWKLRRSGVKQPFFVQERAGRNGRPFRMYKFRTLRDDADPYAVAPRDAKDPRITDFGRFLRVSSIDELPQLLNVLKGDMSLVGPRPEMPFIIEEYDDWQRRRLSVPPGITGLWQILGRKDLPMHDNLQYDFYYIRNRSLTRDLSILLRTAGAVVSRRGAF
jgi:exopolysaccharide biosynthesis polyprenyl glycosylphosphotransferase